MIITQLQLGPGGKNRILSLAAIALFTPFVTLRTRDIADSSGIDFHVILRIAPIACTTILLALRSSTSVFHARISASKAAWLLFLVWASISALYSSDALYGTYQACLLWGACITLWCCPIHSKEDASHLLKSFAVLLISTSVLFLALHPTNGFFLTPDADGGTTYRFSGSFGHPVVFSSACAVLIGSLVSLEGFRPHKSTFAIIVPLLVMMIASLSRTSVAALSCGAVTAYAINRRGGLSALATFFLLTTFALSFIDLREINQLFSRSGSTNELVTLTGRTAFWPDVIRLCLDDPVVGQGLGSSKLSLWSSASGNFRPTHAHNHYLQLWLEVGLIGLTINILAFTLISKQIWQSDLRTISAFLIVFFVISSIPEIPFYTYSPFMLVLFCMHTLGERLHHQSESTQSLRPLETHRKIHFIKE
jgi:O-antigen ligase